MRRRFVGAFIVFALMLCAAASASGQDAGAAEGYAATVKKGEARFTMPVPERDRWTWRARSTRERAREYMMAVRVKNEGAEYSFGFFLWKFPGATEGRGRFSALLAAGQKNLFVRTSAGHNIIDRSVEVKVKQDGDRLVITVPGRKNVERLFASRPAEVTFLTEIPGEQPTAKNVAVRYED